MKTAKVLRKDIKPPIEEELFLIETNNDMADYERFTRSVAGRTVNDVLKDDYPLSKFDHMIYGKPAIQKSTMRFALHRAAMYAEESRPSIFGNPMYHLFAAGMERITTIKRCLADSGKVFVNRAGGVLPYTKRKTVILERYDSDPWDTMKPPQPTASTRTKTTTTKLHGWLLPNGVLHFCEPNGHNALTGRITKQKWSVNLEREWIRLSYGQFDTENDEPTQKQIDAMFDYTNK